MSLKDLILSANDRKTTQVLIPEWLDEAGKPVSVTIQELMSSDRDAIELYVGNCKDSNVPVENYRARIAVRIVIDEKGNRVFSDADIPALSGKSAKALDRLFDAHLKLNKLSKEEIEEYEKNS